MIWLKYIALCVVIHEVYSSQLTEVRLYYKTFGEELLYTAQLAGERCTTLPGWARDKAQSVYSNKCLMLFSRPSCEGHSYELPIGQGAGFELPHFEKSVDSLRLCKKHEMGRTNNWKDQDLNQEKLEDFPLKKVEFYNDNDYRRLLWDTVISPLCTTLHDYDFNSASSVITDVCLMLYSQPHCKGSSYEVKENATSLSSFDDYTQSFRPCTKEAVLGDPKLTIKVTKFKYFKLPESATKLKGRQFRKKTYLTNNGTATMKQPFEVTWEDEQKTVMSWGEMSSTAHEVSVSSTVEVESEVGIPGIGKSKVTASLTAGYVYNKGKETTKGEEREVSEKKTIKLGEEVTVPACTIYEVKSYAKIVKGYAVRYETEMEVTGMQGEKKMKAEEIKSKLSDKVTYLRNKDAYTVVAQGNGKIITDFKAKSGILSNGRKIPVANCERY